MPMRSEFHGLRPGLQDIARFAGFQANVRPYLSAYGPVGLGWRPFGAR
jgi:hypothetical protein